MPDAPADSGSNANRLDAELAGFTQKLIPLAQRQLDQRLAARVDGEDIVQSAFRTFLRRNKLGEFRLASAAELWRLLVHITLMKARAHGRRHTAGKRDVRLEQKQADGWDGRIEGREPRPDDAVALVDTVEWLLSGLPDWYGKTLEMRLEDRTSVEIAAGVGRSRQSVQRALRVLRHRLEQKSEGDS